MTDADGADARSRYMRRRFIPPADGRDRRSSSTRSPQGERLDHITARYLGDPTQFWRICDANDALRPAELTDEPGRRDRRCRCREAGDADRRRSASASMLLVGTTIPLPAADAVLTSALTQRRRSPTTTDGRRRLPADASPSAKDARRRLRACSPPASLDPLHPRRDRRHLRRRAGGADRRRRSPTTSCRRATSPGTSTLTVTGKRPQHDARPRGANEQYPNQPDFVIAAAGDRARYAQYGLDPGGRRRPPTSRSSSTGSRASRRPTSTFLTPDRRSATASSSTSSRSRSASTRPTGARRTGSACRSRR